MKNNSQSHSDEKETNFLVLKDLSDIKTNLAINTNETQNIKITLLKVENSVTQIQSDFISRREFNDRISTVEEQISPLKKVVYGCIALILVGFVSGLLVLIYK